MPDMYDISPLSYIPSQQMDWFTKAVFGGKLIEKGKITPITGVKESTLLNLLEFDGKILQPDKRDCGWTPEQIMKLSEKELKIKTYKINLEQCIDALEQKRTVWMLKPGAKNTELPDSLEAATLEIIAIETSKEIETMIFAGDSATDPDEFDGAVKVLTDSAESVKITGVQLTKANILEEIEKLFLAIPEAVLEKGTEKGTLAIFMSYSTHLLLKLSLSSLFNSNVVISTNWTIDGDIIRYMGVEIVPVIGLNNSTMIAVDIDNFILGTDLLSDFENIRLGQFPAPNDSKVFIDGRLRIGFTIPFESEAVIYSPNVTTTVAPLAAKTNAVVKPPLAAEQIEKINAATTVEEVNTILGTDTRTTVVKAANDKIAELSKTE